MVRLFSVKYSKGQANPDKPVKSATVDPDKPPIVDPAPKPAKHVFSGTLNTRELYHKSRLTIVSREAKKKQAVRDE